MLVVGLGADGDSKVRKYYTERFKMHQGRKNSVIDIDFESFDYNFIVEDFSEIGIERPTIIGDGVAQLEHFMKTYENDKMRCGLWRSNVFVKDKQNVQAALRILQKEVFVCMEAWNAEETEPGFT